jgi:hypothetical protein
MLVQEECSLALDQLSQEALLVQQPEVEQFLEDFQEALVEMEMEVELLEQIIIHSTL